MSHNPSPSSHLVFEAQRVVLVWWALSYLDALNELSDVRVGPIFPALQPRELGQQLLTLLQPPFGDLQHKWQV